MNTQIRILGLIPARGGSKGVPRKNIRDLCGAPLLAWTIDCALRSRLITNVCVSTDDEEIRQVALRYGVQAPFLRPAELATDHARALPVAQHAVREMEKLHGITYDIIAYLQPTSPLRSQADLDKALEQLLSTPDATAIISVVDVGNVHPLKMKKILGTDGRSGHLVDYEKPPVEGVLRQNLPPVFMVNGVLYAMRRRVLMEENTFYGAYALGYIMPPERSVNIDTEIDFVIAEYECQRQERVPPQPKG